MGFPRTATPPFLRQFEFVNVGLATRPLELIVARTTLHGNFSKRTLSADPNWLVLHVSWWDRSVHCFLVDFTFQ